MPTNFPGGQDSFPAAADLADDTLATKPHSDLHGDLGDAVAAIEALVVVAGAPHTITQVPNSVSGVGNMNLILFDTYDAMLALGIAGDAFPRWIWTSDGIFLGDGTFDPFTSGSGTGFAIIAPYIMEMFSGHKPGWSGAATITLAPGVSQGTVVVEGDLSINPGNKITLHTGGDVIHTVDNTGPVLTDRTSGFQFRLFVNGGVLAIEPA